MRTKLTTFQEYTQSLYPHEVDYLLSVQNFSKKSNLCILQQIHTNSTLQHITKAFDANIDKRTYSYVKTWMQDTLSKIDVDVFFEWLIWVEKKVLTDIVSPSDEAEILSFIKHIKPTYYYFMRFYEFLQYYRDYLLVRSRTKYNRVVSEYLDKYKDNYLKSTQINQQLHLITTEIVNKETVEKEELASAEVLLQSIYYDEELDAYTRYRAIVRLTIYFYNNRQFDKQLIVYQHLDELFKTPLFYSKRLLANYYANRAMMHFKLNELVLAEKYGYLSIKNKNSDYLFYLINLCGVLLKQNKKEEALTLMRNSILELKNTNNNYYKIGFASFYIKTLIVNQKGDKAVEYASNYFDVYKKEIFEFRWHLFFCAYLQSLIQTGKYTKILSLCRRYKLIQKEKLRIDRADYIPVIQFYSLISEYLENIITAERLTVSIVKLVQNLMLDKYRSRKVFELLDEIAQNLPDEIKSIKKELQALNF